MNEGFKGIVCVKVVQDRPVNFVEFFNILLVFEIFKIPFIFNFFSGGNFAKGITKHKLSKMVWDFIGKISTIKVATKIIYKDIID